MCVPVGMMFDFVQPVKPRERGIHEDAPFLFGGYLSHIKKVKFKSGNFQ